MDRTTAAGYTIVNGKRVYQDRDKPNGIAGTSLIAADRTAVQEELMNLITAAGLTPDAKDLTQVLQAINKIMSGSEMGYFLKSGDTAAWVTSDGWVVAGNSRVMSGGSGANGDIQAGDYVWSDGITSYGYGKMAVSLSVTDVNGKGGDYRSGGLLQFTAFDGTQTNFYFRGDGYIYDQSGNKFLKAADLTNSLSGYLENYNPGIALALPGTSLCVNPADGLPYLAYAGNTKIAALAWNSDLAAESSARASAIASETTERTNADNNLQAQISSKLDSSFVASGLFDGSQGSTTSGTIVGGTWMRIGNVLRQSLVIENIAGGTVTFPFPFTGSVSDITVQVEDGTGSNSTFTTGNPQLASIGIHSSGGGASGRLHLTAEGPYGT